MRELMLEDLGICRQTFATYFLMVYKQLIFVAIFCSSFFGIEIVYGNSKYPEILFIHRVPADTQYESKPLKQQGAQCKY